jgi:HK97 gp10 family phage protein
MARNAVVVDTDLGFNKILRDLVAIDRYELLVGIQEGSKTTGKTSNGRKQPVGLNIAQYAAENEFGTRTIPQRSFMRTAFDQNIQVIDNFISQQLANVTDGASLDKSFKLVGQLMTGLIQTKIRQITFPPNSKRTIVEKGSSKPLIDFGSMIAAVRYTIRKR